MSPSTSNPSLPTSISPPGSTRRGPGCRSISATQNSAAIDPARRGPAAAIRPESTRLPWPCRAFRRVGAWEPNASPTQMPLSPTLSQRIPSGSAQTAASVVAIPSAPSPRANASDIPSSAPRRPSMNRMPHCMLSSGSSGGTPNPLSNPRTADIDATSPAGSPPMPSATTSSRPRPWRT